MKKQDMIDAIQSKYETVFSVTEKEELENVKWYVAYVFDATGDNATKRNVGFYVKNEGTVDEKAFWHGNEPKPTPPAPIPTFQQKLQEHLTALIVATDNKVEGGTIQSLDAVNKIATVSISLKSDINNNITEKHFFIDKDAQDNWQRREIIS